MTEQLLHQQPLELLPYPEVGIIKLDVGGDLKVAGDITLSTVNTSGLATLNSAAITGNDYWRNLEVKGNFTTTLATTGLTTLNSVSVTTNARINDLDVTTNIDAATLSTTGLATLNNAVVANVTTINDLV
jgi:hypothetical protein